MGRDLSAAPTATRRHGWDEQRGWPALGLILALHGGALWGLMQIEAVREAVAQTAPLMVSLITLPPPQPEPPKVEPLPPRPQPRKPTPPAPVLAAPTPEPTPIVVPEPEPIVVEPPPPPPPAEPAPPAPIVPPSFVAAYLDNPAPAYPPTSRRLGETGLVLLRVRVSATGRAESVTVQNSSGHDRLDRAALDAVRRWKFVPARQGEQAVSADVLVPINFDLNRQ